MDIIAYFYAKNKKVVQPEQPFQNMLFKTAYFAKISNNFLLASSIEQLL